MTAVEISDRERIRRAVVALVDVVSAGSLSCDVCDRTILEGDEHTPHDPGCHPADTDGGCHCAAIVCDTCCWTCQDPGADDPAAII